MSLKLTRLIRSFGLAATAAVVLVGGALGAPEPDQDNQRPPQVLPQGFESTDGLLRDLERAETHRFTRLGSSKAAGS
jgi:hypothetical protein